MKLSSLPAIQLVFPGRAEDVAKLMKLNPELPESCEGASAGITTGPRERSGEAVVPKVGETQPPVVSEAEREQAETHFQKGTDLAEQGRIAEVEAELRAALKLDPTPITSWQILADVCKAQGKWAEMEAACRAMIKLDPNDGVPHADLAEALLNLGRRDEAIQEAKEAIRLGDDDEPIYKKLGLKR